VSAQVQVTLELTPDKGRLESQSQAPGGSTPATLPWDSGRHRAHQCSYSRLRRGKNFLLHNAVLCSTASENSVNLLVHTSCLDSPAPLPSRPVHSLARRRLTAHQENLTQCCRNAQPIEKWKALCAMLRFKASIPALILSLATLLVTTPSIQAHSGGLDRNGCHRNRRTGEYHCHRAPAVSPRPTTPAALSHSAGSAVVWVNTSSGVYHCSDSRWFGQTKRGRFLSQPDANVAGFRPA
jgi:hypothetical protein